MGFGDYIKEKGDFFGKNPDYMIRQVNAVEYEVTKWTKGKAPKDIYRCFHDKRNNTWQCSCPVRKNTCKHIDLVKDWIKQGKPNPIDSKDFVKFGKELFK